MVKLTEVEDEHFSEKPISSDGALLVDDDEDYTDTDSSLSDDEFPRSSMPEESLTDRILALRDIVPPSARTRIASTCSTLYRSTSTGITYGGKGLWILCTSVLFFGMPYALALGADQEMLEQERQQGIMADANNEMIGAVDGGEGRAAL